LNGVGILFFVLFSLAPLAFTDKRATASRSENSITYQYSFTNGVEELCVNGNMPEDDVKLENILKEFRKSTGITAEEVIETKIKKHPEAKKSFSLLSLSKDIFSYKASDLISYIFADKNIFDVKKK